MIPFPAEASFPNPGSFANPLYEGYFADPFVFSSGGEYFAVGTGPTGDPATELPMLRSKNLRSWESLGGALLRSRPPGSHHWAPEVAEHDGVFYMYYSVGVSDERHELRVASSALPEGPYRELADPLLDPLTASFAIDPSPFRDIDGRWYLFYARDFLDSEDGARPGTALVVAPLVGMTAIPPTFTTVMRAHHDWQRFEPNRPIYGGVYDWHTLEGPTVIRHGGRYYCLYSGGNWQNESYGIDFVVADSLTGPWHDSNPGDRARVLRTIPGKIIGPGHNSVTRDLDGCPLVAFHAWDAAKTARRLHLDRLVWTLDGPRAASFA
jgi:beta-xylosidase